MKVKFAMICEVQSANDIAQAAQQIVTTMKGNAYNYGGQQPPAPRILGISEVIETPITNLGDDHA